MYEKLLLFSNSVLDGLLKMRKRCYMFVTVSNVFEAVLNAFVEHCASCNGGVLGWLLFIVCESVDSNVCVEQARLVLEDNPENFENDLDR